MATDEAVRTIEKLLQDLATDDLPARDTPVPNERDATPDVDIIKRALERRGAASVR